MSAPWYCRRRWRSWLFLVALLAPGCNRPVPSSSVSTPVGAKTAVPLAPGADAQRRLQRALINAQPGQTIELASGRFELTGTLSLDVAGVKLRGQGIDKTILDFQSQTAGTGGEGLSITRGPVLIEDLAIENPKGDALKVSGASGVTIRRVRAEWTGSAKETNGSYGIYPVQCQEVLVEACIAKGASDAGIYVGQSKNIIVRNNQARGNVAGIEIENSERADVHNNHVEGNTGGILVFSLPNLPAGNGRECRVFDNVVLANNHPNFAPQGNIVAKVPPGTGIMIMAYDEVEVFGNRAENNDTANVVVLSYLTTQLKYDDPKYDPYPEKISIHHNHFVGGGARPGGQLGSLLSPLTGGKFASIVIDGIVDEQKRKSGQIGGDFGIAIHDNGGADFLNLDLGNFEPLQGRMPKIRRDLAAHATAQPPLPPVRLQEVQ